MDNTGHIFSFIFSTRQEKRHLHGSQELSITVISSAWCLKKNLQSAVNITRMQLTHKHSPLNWASILVDKALKTHCVISLDQTMHTVKPVNQTIQAHMKEREMKDRGVNLRCKHTYKCWWICIVYPLSMLARNKAISWYPFSLICKQPYAQYETSLTSRLLLMQGTAESETCILSSLWRNGSSAGS